MRLKFVSNSMLLLGLTAISVNASNVQWDLSGPGNVADGRPDIIWRRKSNVDTYVWQMTLDATVKLAWNGSVNALPNTGDVYWKICGTGNFDGNGQQDIVWQHQNTGVVFVWLMNGPNFISPAVQITGTPPGSGWKVVGVGDFGSAPSGTPTTILDGKPDIVWQTSHHTSESRLADGRHHSQSDTDD